MTRHRAVNGHVACCKVACVNEPAACSPGGLGDHGRTQRIPRSDLEARISVQVLCAGHSRMTKEYARRITWLLHASGLKQTKLVPHTVRNRRSRQYQFGDDLEPPGNR